MNMVYLALAVDDAMLRLPTVAYASFYIYMGRDLWQSYKDQTRSTGLAHRKTPIRVIDELRSDEPRVV
jgi:hypothetical protein